MAIALIVLALGSIVAGYIGIPAAIWKDGNKIEHFLEPSFEAHGPGVAERRASEAGVEEDHDAEEWALMGGSSLAAGGGIFLAFFYFLRKPSAADAMAKSFSGVYRTLLNKYYVDELYDKTIVQPIKAISSGVLWRWVDAGLIDGTVNAVGLVVRGWSAVLRRLQTGSMRAYAMSVFLGVVVILGYFLWK